jgi:NO-binding membrane sensor protein with MHYT domain
MDSSNNTSSNSYYSNGDTIPQVWCPIFVVFAFFTSFIASFAAVRLLDHTTWRSDKERDHASSIFIKGSQVISAFLLGFGTVWSMHFIGMSAVTLEHTPRCYNWPITVGSLVSSVFFMWAGVNIAERDIFAGPDRVEVLKKIVIQYRDVTVKGQQSRANRKIHMVAFFHKPWYILGGAVVAATGALVMHYTGMMALHGAFSKHWSIMFVSVSVGLGVLVCCAGFWILFRLLRWKVEQFWLRPVSAAVIALAVCSLHFFGMLSVTYVYDDSLNPDGGACNAINEEYVWDPNRWTALQTLDLALALIVPSLALLIEIMISRELFHAYCKLQNPELTVECITKAAARSHDSTTKRASQAVLIAQSMSIQVPQPTASHHAV